MSLFREDGHTEAAGLLVQVCKEDFHGMVLNCLKLSMPKRPLISLFPTNVQAHPKVPFPTMV